MSVLYVDENPKIDYLPALTTSIPTTIEPLRLGKSNLYKSSLALALIYFKTLEKTPILALLSLPTVRNYDGTPISSKAFLIYFLYSGL